jgi:hypothetical protein
VTGSAARAGIEMEIKSVVASVFFGSDTSIGFPPRDCVV